MVRFKYRIAIEMPDQKESGGYIFQLLTKKQMYFFKYIGTKLNKIIKTLFNFL